METAPLTLAHAHARKASQETAKAKLTIAANDHESAAGEFAKAAETTHDAEALRMLKLLQEHHHRLAEIIKTKHVIAKQLDETGDGLSQKTAHTEQTTTAAASLHTAPDTLTHTSRASGPVLGKMAQQRRDTSPALAKDMASRRGIPQPQTRKIPPPIIDATSVHASDSRSQRNPAAKQRAVGEALSTTSAAQLQHTSPSPADDGFSRFYSTLTSGPFSKISSMLAFAALPLNESTSQPSSPTSSRIEKTSAKAHDGPDIRKLISPAAMNALEEGQKRQGHGGQSFGGESFYVVPPSGGTTSYANIMRTEQRYARRQGHLSHISEEDNEFVDARETQAARTSGANSLSVSHGRPGVHRVEELELENDSLKQVLDQMSHRLQAFERSAQDASMAALTQSMASVRTTGGGDTAHGDRDRMAEDELQKAIREITKLKGQNQKYKSYLERLKDSARQKEREKRERGEGPA